MYFDPSWKDIIALFTYNTLYKLDKQLLDIH